jgi:hypothetical protein
MSPTLRIGHGSPSEGTFTSNRTARVPPHHRQRRESVTRLIHHPQRLSTRRQHTKAREPGGETLDEIGHGEIARRIDREYGCADQWLRTAVFA